MDYYAGIDVSLRTVHGQEQEVIFRQTHEPGRLGLSVFSDMGLARPAAVRATLPQPSASR